jgi:hypothetical protein
MREGQGHVTACTGSTGPPALCEAAAPRGVDRASAECGDQARYGVGGRGSVRAKSDGCRVESRDCRPGPVRENQIWSVGGDITGAARRGGGRANTWVGNG